VRILNSKNKEIKSYLYRIEVRITLKAENPYLHSVNSKNPGQRSCGFLVLAPPGQTGTQFVAE